MCEFVVDVGHDKKKFARPTEWLGEKVRVYIFECLEATICLPEFTNTSVKVILVQILISISSLFFFRSHVRAPHRGIFWRNWYERMRWSRCACANFCAFAKNLTLRTATHTDKRTVKTVDNRFNHTHLLGRLLWPYFRKHSHSPFFLQKKSSQSATQEKENLFLSLRTF